MLINRSSLELAFKGFKSVFDTAYMEAPSTYEKVAMIIPSNSFDETYSWLSLFPAMREWIGARVVNRLGASTFTIRNLLFESTIAVDRTDFEDDKIGLFKAAFAEMGGLARRHPDEMIYKLLKSGFTTNGFDGQFFFDTDHPVITADGGTVAVSNTGGGAGAPWFLMDTSRAMKPLIWQERIKPEFQRLDEDFNEEVFNNDRYLYGVRSRANAGFGLWQLAYGSQQPLTAANYAAARAAMQGYRADGGRLLGILPNVLVVPPALESAGLQLLNSEYGTGGVTNEWKGTAQLVVTPYLS